MKKIICAVMAVALIFVTGMYTTAATTSLNMGALIADQANWEGTMNEPGAAGQTEFTSDSLYLKAGAIKSAGYLGSSYRNFVLDFKYNVTWPEDAGDWGGMLTFRDNTPGLHTWEAMDGEGTYKKAYGVYFYLDPNADEVQKAGEISITRFVNNDGDTGPENLGDSAVCKGLNLSGKDHIYRLVCEDVSNGVHIMLYMDGKIIINFTDSGSKALKQDGNFMVMNHGPRSVKISGVKSNELPNYSATSSKPASTSSVKKSTASSVNPSSSQIVSSNHNVPSSTEQKPSVKESSDVDSTVNDTSSVEDEEPNKEPSDVKMAEEEKGNGSLVTVIIIVAVTVVILGAAVVAGSIIMKKKKQ